MQKGFIFIETIITIVILTGSLLFLYQTFNNTLQNEKARIYYDDTPYIYRTYYLKDNIVKLNIDNILKNDEDFTTIGLDSDIFNGNSESLQYIANLFQDFDVKQVIILHNNKLDNLKTCTLECSLDNNCIDYERCSNLYFNLSEDLVNYLKTIYVNTSANNLLVAEYQTCYNNYCHNYYSWVSV